MKYITNLFSKKEETAIDKITYFALHYLRYILVITQFVTICVFFYRFKIDQEIVDLKDTLSQKKAIVETTQNLLTNVKELDFKINNIKSISGKQDTLLDIYTYIFQKLPQDVRLTSLTIEGTSIQFQGQTTNITAVQDMYEKMQQEKIFKSVVLGGITKNETGFAFNLELTDYSKSNGN
ncbi:MAG TPA: PilN domain-containing protein [Candidatus Woesebacteria bacterium]|nr:PilN domain-containing protein [Candidatus Woesebacteria bacterium]